MELKYDLYRIKGKNDIWTLIQTFFSNRTFRFIVYYRLERKYCKNIFLFSILRFFSHLLNRKMSIEIPTNVQIGRGLLLLHPHAITINSKAVIGDNFTIMKGATIGNIKGGKRNGTPIIGDNVYVGLNSTIVGNVTIGNNVLIAANTFVNFDVPDGAMVIGSPGIIHPGHGSENYIVNSIKDFK